MIALFEDPAAGFAPASTPFGGGFLVISQTSPATSTTHPAVGDVDGDGRAEIVVGSVGSGGLLSILDDAETGYAPHPDAPIAGGFLAVPIAGSSGETRPALCDHDGDGKAELVVGFSAEEGGRLQLYDDADQGFAPQPRTDGGVIETGWDGGTFPACGNLDGDAREELLIGGEGDGWMLLLDDKKANFRDIGGGWIDLERPGLARPAMGN